MKKLFLILMLFSTLCSGQNFFWSHSKIYYNVQLCDNFTRNNCAVGETGSTETVCISPGDWASGISQADADEKAHQELYHTDHSGVAGYGQYTANTVGTCTSGCTGTYYLFYEQIEGRDIATSEAWTLVYAAMLSWDCFNWTCYWQGGYTTGIEGSDVTDIECNTKPDRYYVMVPIDSFDDKRPVQVVSGKLHYLD